MTVVPNRYYRYTSLHDGKSYVGTSHTSLDGKTVLISGLHPDKLGRDFVEISHKEFLRTTRPLCKRIKF